MLFLPLFLSTLLSTSYAATVCNGQASFCSRSYSNVSVIGTHNSYAVGAGNVAANQNYTIKTQLDNGVRLLQVQGMMNNGALHLCHTSCLLIDYGTFTSYLKVVKTWLDANPNEVVTLLLVNSDLLSSSVWAASYAAANLTSSVFVPASVPIAYNNWPTLGNLIDSGTRLVNFLAQNADASAQPFLMDEFTNIWETPFDETDVAFPCTVNRVTGSAVGKMYLINHFLDVNITLLGQQFPIPARNALNQTNGISGIGSLTVQSDACIAQHKQKPTFTLVDYYDVGSVFQYTASLNNVPYVAGQIGNGTTTSAGSTSTNGSSSSAGGSTTSTPLRASSTTVSIGLSLAFVALASLFLV